MSEPSEADRMRWWGSIDLDEDGTHGLQIGPTAVWITRQKHEWRFAWDTDRDQLGTTRSSASALAVEAEPSPEASIKRIGFRQTTGKLEILPAMPDRPLVTSPTTALGLPPGEEIKLYFSSPLWIVLRAAGTALDLVRFPIFRPSDTWFGPSTREGEICYASRTSAHLKRESLNLRQHRAFSEVSIRNSGRDILAVERLKIPVMHLSLFEGSDGYLWTQHLILEKEEREDLAKVTIGKTPPQEVHPASRICGPQTEVSRQILPRAFSAFFSQGGTRL